MPFGRYDVRRFDYLDYRDSHDHRRHHLRRCLHSLDVKHGTRLAHFRLPAGARRRHILDPHCCAMCLQHSRSRSHFRVRNETGHNRDAENKAQHHEAYDLAQHSHVTLDSTLLVEASNTVAADILWHVLGHRPDFEIPQALEKC